MKLNFFFFCFGLIIEIFQTGWIQDYRGHSLPLIINLLIHFFHLHCAAALCINSWTQASMDQRSRVRGGGG